MAVKSAFGKVTLLDVGEMLSTPAPAVAWVVKPIVPRGSLILLPAPPKAGKSLLCTAFAVGVVHGPQTLAGGIECTAGRVLIIDAENGQSEIHRRIKNLGLADSSGFEVAEVRGFDLRGDLGDLEDAIRATDPDLVILDSYRSLWVGDENKTEEVAPVLDRLRNLVRDLNVACILIHHLNKNGTSRGSTAIEASCEATFRLEKHPDDTDKRRRVLRNTMCRFGPEADDMWLRIEADSAIGITIDEAEPPDDVEVQPRGVASKSIVTEIRPLLTDEPQSGSALARAAGKRETDGTFRRGLIWLTENGEANRVAGGYVRAPIADVIELPTSPSPVASGNLASGNPA